MCVSDMKLDADTLREAGEALYGNQWQMALSLDLQVSDRTMRRWANGEFGIPDGIWPELAKLCRSRGRALERLAVKLAGA